MENQKIVALQNIFSSRLDTLSHILEVAESHFTDDMESLLQRRLAPDMLPLVHKLHSPAISLTISRCGA